MNHQPPVLKSTLGNSAVGHRRLDHLEAVVLEEVVEVAFPDPASLNPVRVDALQEEGVEVENLAEEFGSFLTKTSMTDLYSDDKMYCFAMARFCGTVMPVAGGAPTVN